MIDEDRTQSLSQGQTEKGNFHHHREVTGTAASPSVDITINIVGTNTGLPDSDQPRRHDGQ